MCAGRVLIADSDQEFRRDITKTLEKAGYEVTEVNNGKEALNLLITVETSFDLVISELRMVQLDGLELLREIILRRIKVVYVCITAWGDVVSLLDMFNLGAFEYVNKPVESTELLSIVKNAIASGKEDNSKVAGE